jgi:hypothetical protein
VRRKGGDRRLRGHGRARFTVDIAMLFAIVLAIRSAVPSEPVRRVWRISVLVMPGLDPRLSGSFEV